MSEGRSEQEKIPYWITRIKESGVRLESHVRLFIHEGAELMDKAEFQRLLKKYLKADLQRKYEEDFEENQYAAKRRLFKLLSHNGSKPLYSLIKIIKRSQDQKVIEQLKLENVSLDYYKKFFIPVEGQDDYKMDRISIMLYTDPIIRYFKTRNVKDYDDLIKKFDPSLPRQQKKPTVIAACEILRTLPFCSDKNGHIDRHLGDAFFDFIEACLEDPEGYNRNIPRFIDPNYFDELAQFQARKNADSKIFVPNTEDIVDPDYYPDEPRPQNKYSTFKQLFSNIDYKSEDIDLRPYQIELAANAINGKNTIICAPTGSGKTHVVTHIAKGHLELSRRENKIARVVMLVPTIPLVDQQVQYLLRFLGGEYWIDGVSGVENREERAGYLLACDIVVMTPQILVNMLSSVVKNDKVFFSDFTMMIFDECHHCHHSHPYKTLMDMLSEHEGKIKNVPQIVGLTASLGVGQTSWNIAACKDHMLDLCAHLRAESISTVRHQIEDLKRYVRPPADIVERIERPRDDRLSLTLGDVIREIEKSIIPDLEKLIKATKIPLKKEDLHFPDLDREWTRYQNCIGNIRSYVEKLRDTDVRFQLTRQIQQLSFYFQALRINELLPVEYTLDYLKSKIGEFFDNLQPSGEEHIDRTHEFLGKIYKKFYEASVKPLLNKTEDQKMGKPILKRLYEILHNEFSSNPQSRCLIFVTTRACAKNLSEHLNKVRALPMFYEKKLVSFMVSSNQTTMAGGQSAREQQEIQDSFKNGKIKVLVVTSVAEEGINIAECNLIIKYNSVGSERTLIQRRGRARALNSKSFLLALDNAVEQQEFQNIRKEALMHECIRDLQENDDETLRQMIMAKKKEHERNKAIKDRANKERREMLKTRRYKLKCKSCQNWICESYFIRMVSESNFVCCDPEIWSRTNFLIIKRPTREEMFVFCAKLICRHCQQEWGQVIKYSNVFLPTITASSFVLEQMDNRQFDYTTQDGRSVKTWRIITENYFNVEPLSIKNMKDMYESLRKYSKEYYDKMAMQEEVANLDVKEKIRKYHEKVRERRGQFRNVMEE